MPACGSPSSQARTRARDLFRVLPYWPRDRFLELCPRDWLSTRARLDTAELEFELGPIVVPEATTSSAEQSPAG